MTNKMLNRFCRRIDLDLREVHELPVTCHATDEAIEIWARHPREHGLPPDELATYVLDFTQVDDELCLQPLGDACRLTTLDQLARHVRKRIDELPRRQVLRALIESPDEALVTPIVLEHSGPTGLKGLSAGVRHVPVVCIEALTANVCRRIGDLDFDVGLHFHNYPAQLVYVSSAELGEDTTLMRLIPLPAA